MTSEEGWVDITGVAAPLSVSKDSIYMILRCIDIGYVLIVS